MKGRSHQSRPFKEFHMHIDRHALDRYASHAHRKGYSLHVCFYIHIERDILYVCMYHTHRAGYFLYVGFTYTWRGSRPLLECRIDCSQGWGVLPALRVP